MFGLGTSELLVIGVIVFLIFGAKRLPEIGKGLGGAVREFKQIKKDVGKTPESGVHDADAVPPEKKEAPSIENKMAEKAIEQAPGVKKVLDAKKKVDKVRELMKS